MVGHGLLGRYALGARGPTRVFINTTLSRHVPGAKDRMVLGSRNYVNGVFAEYRDRFGPRRKNGARPLRGLEALSDLATMRDLRVDVVR